MVRALIAAVLSAISLGTMAADRMDPVYSDKRLVIPVTAAERNQVLYEMRAFLQGLYNIHNALAQNDMKGLALSARTLAPMLNRVPSNMREHLPVEFLELSNAMRESFEAMAHDAETSKDAAKVQGHLAETVAYCAGCHETFRFQVKSMARK